MPLYDFICPDGHVTERIRGYEVDSAPCRPPCIKWATRKGFNVVSVEVRDAPTEVKDRDGKVNVTRFQEASQEIAYGYEQIEKKEGHKVKAPNLYKAGIREAKRRGAKMRV